MTLLVNRDNLTSDEAITIIKAALHDHKSKKFVRSMRAHVQDGATYIVLRMDRSTEKWEESKTTALDIIAYIVAKSDEMYAQLSREKCMAVHPAMARLNVAVSPA